MPDIIVILALIVAILSGIVSFFMALDSYDKDFSLTAFLFLVSTGLGIWLYVAAQSPQLVETSISVKPQKITNTDGTSIQIIIHDNKVVNLTEKLGRTIPDNVEILIVIDDPWKKGIYFVKNEAQRTHYEIVQIEK